GQGVGENAHTAAADEAVVPAVIVVEAEGQDAGHAVLAAEDAQGPLLDLGLDAAAAEGAALAAVGEDEHGGAGLLRRRAARLDHRAVNALPSLAEHRGQFREQFTHGCFGPGTCGGQSPGPLHHTAPGGGDKPEGRSSPGVFVDYCRSGEYLDLSVRARRRARTDKSGSY